MRTSRPTLRRDRDGRYRVLAITAAPVEQGVDLAERHGLGGDEALHLAVALALAARQWRSGWGPGAPTGQHTGL
jgi:hypothetical protein